MKIDILEMIRSAKDLSDLPDLGALKSAVMVPMALNDPLSPHLLEMTFEKGTIQFRIAGGTGVRVALGSWMLEWRPIL